MTAVTMDGLRERGVYRLAGFVMIAANINEDGGWALYTQREWDSESPADLEIRPAGALVFQGEPTGQTVGALRDTGRTA